MTAARYDCPACDGIGEWVTVISLYWNGNQVERLERCDRCQGTGCLTYDELTPDEKDKLIEAEMIKPRTSPVNQCGAEA